MFTFDAVTLEPVGEMMAFLVDLVGSSSLPPCPSPSPFLSLFRFHLANSLSPSMFLMILEA